MNIQKAETIKAVPIKIIVVELQFNPVTQEQYSK